jgi:hypothetical protein
MDGASGRLFDAGDMSLSVEGGVRLDLIFYDESGWDLEFAYLGTEDFSAVATPADRDITFTFYDGVPADPAGRYVINYESNLHGCEFNVRHRWRPCLSLLGGIRGVQLHEEFDVINGGATNTGLFSKTYNHLFGFQLGGDLRWWLNDVLGATATLKGGIYNNHISGRAEAVDGGTGDEINVVYNADNASFLGEVGVGLVVAMGHYATLRAGYTAIYITGIAPAPDQNDEFSLFTGQGSPDLGCPFYHGGYIGFDFSY